MKVTIAYQPGEEREAILIQRFTDSVLGGARMHKSDRHPPFKHIYLTDRKPANTRDCSKTNCISPHIVV